MRFNTVGQTLGSYPALDEVDSAGVVSWADMERDASTWLGNKLQDYAFDQLWSLEKSAKAAGGEALEAWRMLGVSDHFMYLCLKSWEDGDVHKHFSPYKDWTPYDNFINYMNILTDYRLKLQQVHTDSEEGRTLPQGWLKLDPKEARGIQFTQVASQELGGARITT
jgi:alpha-amylase